MGYAWIELNLYGYHAIRELSILEVKVAEQSFNHDSRINSSVN